MNAREIDLQQVPHRRLNPLTGDWVLVSPHRTERPWTGHVDAAQVQSRPRYDPSCYLCPGNRRAGGHANPGYDGTYVFDNDFSALLTISTEGSVPEDPMFVAEPVRGACRVICFSPRHDLALADLDDPALVGVIQAWTRETKALGAMYPWVQVFENKGAAMGCSNLHPHGQVWACSALPNEAVKEDAHQRAYLEDRGSVLLVDYARAEIDAGTRIVGQNDDWIAVVPYWAIWPYETLLVPRRQRLRLPDLATAEQASLAPLLGDLLRRYDRLFGVPFPYSMGWHGAPYAQGAVEHWQLHAHVFPPLLRSASVRKYMVGYEMLAEPQRDLTPELAAQRLRALVPSAEGG